MSLIRLDPFIYLMTPLGEAEAHFLRVETSEVAYQWGTFQCESGENWWWPNHLVRLSKSVSADRMVPRTPIELDADELATLAPHIERHRRSPFHASNGVPNRDMEHG